MQPAGRRDCSTGYSQSISTSRKVPSFALVTFLPTLLLSKNVGERVGKINPAVYIQEQKDSCGLLREQQCSVTFRALYRHGFILTAAQRSGESQEVLILILENTRGVQTPTKAIKFEEMITTWSKSVVQMGP